MNVLTRSVINITRSFLGISIKNNPSQLLQQHVTSNVQAGSLVNTTKSLIGSIFQGLGQTRFGSTLRSLHYNGRPYKTRRPKRRPLEGKPFAKGVVIKNIIKKPKKPNSANRKCVVVRLSTGKEMTAYVPGIGHNLQEHNVVLCRVGRLKDTPGVRIRCVRGKYDLPHVTKKQQS